MSILLRGHLYLGRDAIGVTQLVLACLRMALMCASFLPNAWYQYRKAHPTPVIVDTTLIKPRVQYQAVYTITTVLGLTNSVFYAWHLLDIFGRVGLLKQMFSALVEYASSLTSTALLWFVTIYLLCGHRLAWSQNDFLDGNGVAQCDTKLQCVVFSVTTGSGNMQTNEYYQGRFFPRAIHDVPKL
jgi:hypothetical protein